MPFTAQEIQDAGKAVMDYHLKAKPLDLIAEDLPLFNFLMSGKKSFPAAKESIVETLRVRYQSNFQFFNGGQQVTYNSRQSLEEAKFPWRSAHDGLELSEDRLAQHGIAIHDGAPKSVTKAESVRFANLMEEQMEILQLGYKEEFNKFLWLDGTGGADHVAGIDHLVSLDPTTGVVGGIDRTTELWWRNNVRTGLNTGIIAAMEEEWKNCIRYGSGAPKKIYAGWDFIQAFRAEAKAEISRYVSVDKGADAMDPATTLYFMGIPIEWVPQFDDNFGGAVSPLTHWSKRCYFLNGDSIRLRPMEKQDMVSRKPPRAADKYVYQWALTWRGGLTMNNARKNAVLSIA